MRRGRGSRIAVIGAVAAAGLALLPGAAARGLELTPTDQTRTLVADAEAAEGLAFRIEQAFDAAPDFGIFDAVASADGDFPGAFASALAGQLSSIGATEGSASGAALAETGGESEDGFGLAFADSSFDFSFVPDEDLFIRIQGFLEISGDELGDMFASVSLFDIEANMELFGLSLDVFDLCDTEPCPPVPFDVLVPLEAGREYALSAFASAFAPFEESADLIPAAAGGAYSLEYSLLPIPEPASAALVWLGLLALATVSRPPR